MPLATSSHLITREDGLSAKAMMGQDTGTVLQLLINSSNVRHYPQPPEHILFDEEAIASLTVTDQGPSSNSLCLLQGPVEEFARYARHEESQWLMDIAHDICDPAEKRGSLLVWKELERQWFDVAPIDPLAASIYRYHLPDSVTVGLSKISQLHGSSASSATGNPNTMTDRVKSRDEQCWVTEAMLESVQNCHVIPKRIGDHVGRIIFQTFTSLTPPATFSIYNEAYGLCLSVALDRFFAHYRMGFRFVSPNLYECHSFVSEAEGYLTFSGLFRNIGPHIPVHGVPVQPPHPERDNVPPPGLFRWHYLQCVIRKFGHTDYKDLPNIDHYELPFRMKGDSDDDYSTDSNEDWPSKVFDHGRVAEKTLAEREERHRSTAQWISTL